MKNVDVLILLILKILRQILWIRTTQMHSLQKWLKQTSTVHSWRTLADAVEKVNPFVAEQIRKKYAAIL